MIEDPSITKEMEDWFEERTNRHIDMVKKYANQIEKAFPERFKGLTEQAEHHDETKLEEPERTPYVKLSWQHKQDNFKGYKTPGQLPDDEINNATVHHVTNNKHHPEFWQEKQVDLINKEDRDKPPKEMVDGTKMPDMAIAEMVCDWQSMSDELKKNTTREWADRNINVRWKFNENQTKLIYDIIESIEKHNE